MEETQKETKEKKNEQKIEEEYIPCNLCSQDNFTIIYEKINAPLEIPLRDKFSAAKGILSTDQIVKCKNCGLVYTNPRIKSTIIIDSCSQGDDEVYVSQEEGRKKTFQEGIEWIKKVTQKKENAEKEVNKEICSEKQNEKRNILDVGCAAGFFLSVAKENGFKPYGIELNAWLAEYGRKKFNLENVKAGTLENAQWKDNFFEFVTMWDVLEHVPDPMKTLKEINRVTKENGYLIVSYPDYSSIFAKLFGRRWWFLLSHHIYYFTPKTMNMMLQKAGFEIITDKMHWQELKICYMLDMFVKLNKNPLIKTPFHAVSVMLKALGLKDMKVRYYASQRDVIAQKKTIL